MPVKPCLLVVDDEVDMVESVRDLLRREYHVLTATRASEGLEIIANQHVHVVMTDQRMPEMTGVEFLKFLRDRFPDTVRLLFTAYADIGAITDAINQGNVYRYIPKPWQPEELRAVLKQAMDHYQLQADRKRLLQEVQEKNRQLESANIVLKRADELKRAFIKVANHELRTPLTLLVGLCELAMQSEQSLPPLSNWLSQLHGAARRLTGRVDDMLKLYEAERFDLPFQPREANVADLIAGAVREVQHFLQKRRQRLQMSVPDSGTILVEPEKIHDVLVQLLMNAIKFTPDEGVIGIEAVRRDGKGVSITISDTGQGMDADCANRIFDPFFTGFDVSRHCSGTYEHDRRGLGLGLAVVKAFVDRHKGSVEVHSQPG
jgi:signal transduction histidine kinase